jgi:hypothetical protein
MSERNLPSATGIYRAKPGYYRYPLYRNTTWLYKNSLCDGEKNEDEKNE